MWSASFVKLFHVTKGNYGYTKKLHYFKHTNVYTDTIVYLSKATTDEIHVKSKLTNKSLALTKK